MNVIVQIPICNQILVLDDNTLGKKREKLWSTKFAQA